MIWGQLRRLGLWIVCSTLAAAAFAVVGAFIGPSELVGTLLLVGIAVLGVAHVLEKADARRADDRATGEEENYR